MMKVDRRTVLAGTAASLLAGNVSAEQPWGQGFVGPMVGHVSPNEAYLWFRPEIAGSYTLHVTADDEPVRRITGEGQPENDHCLTWTVDSLKPGTRYRYKIVDSEGRSITKPEWQFKTAPARGENSKVCLAFGSCADMSPSPLWSQIEEAEVDGLVLLGDTPYIDSTDLEVARSKHRQFLQIPPLASVIQHTPTWGTWDDHDFGQNDSDGLLTGKENTRKAFTEYRAQPAFGEENAGIYTKFQYGPVEVFLLDTRWFARTEKSPVNPSQPTLLGKRQWQWLKEGLRRSTSPFKVITCGMIWDDKENGESDDWGTYTYEREALFKFLGENNISGVVLIGGDIHCSRLLKYNTQDTVKYPMHQFIVSPIHGRTIPQLNVPHPNLVRGEAVPHVWLRLTVDTTQSPAQLHAEWVQMNDRPMWGLRLSEADLTPA